MAGRIPPPPPMHGPPAPRIQPQPGPQFIQRNAHAIPNRVRVSDITSKPVLDEDYYRKMLTEFHAIVITPLEPRQLPDPAVRFKRGDLKPSQRWLKVNSSSSPMANKDISKRIKTLEEKKPVTKKVVKLWPHQGQQVNNIVGEQQHTEHIREMEWTLAQLEKHTERIHPKSETRYTTSMTLFLKRAPRQDVVCEQLFHHLQATGQLLGVPPPIGHVYVSGPDDHSPFNHNHLDVAGGDGGGHTGPPRGPRPRADRPNDGGRPAGDGGGGEAAGIVIIEDSGMDNQRRRSRPRQPVPRHESPKRRGDRPRVKSSGQRAQSRRPRPPNRQHNRGAHRSRSSSTESSSSSDDLSVFDRGFRTSDTNTSYSSTSDDARGKRSASRIRPRRGGIRQHSRGRAAHVFDIPGQRHRSTRHGSRYHRDPPQSASFSSERRNVDQNADAIAAVLAVARLATTSRRGSRSPTRVMDHFDEASLSPLGARRPLVTHAHRHNYNNQLPSRWPDSIDEEIRVLERSNRRMGGRGRTYMRRRLGREYDEYDDFDIESRGRWY